MKKVLLKISQLRKIHEDMTELLQSAVELRIYNRFYNVSCWGKFTEVDTFNK